MAAETSDVRRASERSTVWGVLMLFCGILAIFMPLASSIGLVILLGWLILISAVWHLIFAFQTRDLGNILWRALLAIPYGFVGFYMLWHPLLGMLTLTLVLAIFLLFEGVLEIILYFNIRKVRNAGWVLLDGIITLILGLSDLGTLAFDLRLGHRNFGRNQFNLHRYFENNAFLRHSPPQHLDCMMP